MARSQKAEQAEIVQVASREAAKGRRELKLEGAIGHSPAWETQDI
uniref:Uncharacterized protein n=1 Tax=Moniliophthora roreri TaxID=221103 RepID=A0A0W0FF51_MONRR